MKKVLLILLITVAAHAVNLDKGWNLLGTANTIHGSELTGCVTKTFTYNTNGVWSTDSAVINANSGFWVNADSDCELLIDVNNTVTEITGVTGWELKGTGQDLDISVFDNASEIRVIWTYDDGIWKAYSPNAEYRTLITDAGYALIETIEAGSGYWVKATSDYTISLPKVVVETTPEEVVEDEAPNEVIEDNNTTEPIEEEEVIVNEEVNETVVEEEVVEEEIVTEEPVEEPIVEEVTYLSNNFDSTDSDGDGMSDYGELKYGYDPYDANSFPVRPTHVTKEIVKIDLPTTNLDSVWVESDFDGLNIKWGDDESYGVKITNASGDILKFAMMDTIELKYSTYDLNGTETLNVEIIHYDNGNYNTLESYALNLSDYELKELSVGNNISFTFKDFDQENEVTYTDFLTKVWPILEDKLGDPSETFNMVITNMGPNSAFFGIRNQGRTFLSTQDFFPRLIVHEMVHGWKGRFVTVSDSEWSYTGELSGFEEGLAEGLAFEIMQEFMRVYPNDSTTEYANTNRSYNHNDIKSSHYDLMKFMKQSRSGEYWTAGGFTAASRYTIAGTTVTNILKEYPNFYKDVQSKFMEKVMSNNTWVPNRSDLVAMWAEAAPTVQDIEMEKYLNALPVFDGEGLEDGALIVADVRPYNNGVGVLNVAPAYVINGSEWWSLGEDEEDISKIPDNLSTVNVDGEVYLDLQVHDYSVSIYNNGSLMNTLSGTSTGSYSNNGTPNGFSFDHLKDLDDNTLSMGFYTMDIEYPELNLKEEFYMYSTGNTYINRDVMNLFVGFSIGRESDSSTMELDGLVKEVDTENSLAHFELNEVEEGYEGVMTLTVKAGEQTCSYKRTLIDTYTMGNDKEIGYHIIDKDFNCVEDIYEQQ